MIENSCHWETIWEGTDSLTTRDLQVEIAITKRCRAEWLALRLGTLILQWQGPGASSGSDYDFGFPGGLHPLRVTVEKGEVVFVFSQCDCWTTCIRVNEFGHLVETLVSRTFLHVQLPAVASCPTASTPNIRTIWSVRCALLGCLKLTAFRPPRFWNGVYLQKSQHWVLTPHPPVPVGLWNIGKEVGLSW